MTDHDGDKPHLTPLVIGLTRSPTMWGVPYMAVVITVGITIIAWLVSKSFWTLLFAPASYVILFSLCAWDSKILDVFEVTARKTPRTRNKTFWGTNSYGP